MKRALRQGWGTNLVLLASLCLIWAGLSAPAWAKSRSPHAELTPVSIGIAVVPPKMTFIGFYVAKYKGFFQKEGLNVNLVSFNNGIESLQGVAGGHIDFGATSTADVLAAADHGGHVVNVWGYGVPLDTALVTPKSIQSVAQLKGQTLAWGGPGSFAELNIDAALASAHLTESDVHFVTMDRPEFVPAIVSGKIQGAIFHVDDGLTAQLKDPNLHILVRIYKVLPEWWYGGLAVSTQYAKSHRDVVIRVIKALDLADRWMYSHPKETIALATQYTQEPAKAVAQSYAFLASIHEWTVNTGLEPKYVNYTIAGELRLHWITHHLKYRDVADPAYAEAALRSIGAVHFGY